MSEQALPTFIGICCAWQVELCFETELRAQLGQKLEFQMIYVPIMQGTRTFSI